MEWPEVILTLGVFFSIFGCLAFVVYIDCKEKSDKQVHKQKDSK